MAITETDAKELSYKLQFMEDASVDKFPLLLPAKIGNNNTKLFFDTGASMFSLITSNKRLQNIDNNDADSLCCITNWGRQIPVYRKVLDTPLQIGGVSYENQDIYGCEVLDMVDYLPSWFLYGMTGNRLFHDKIVVIDTENNLVGIEG